MRGKDAAVQSPKLWQRITPAYAGKSLCIAKAQIRHKDHPRLCGEKSFASAVSPYHCGSPPPMRGKGAENNFSPMSNRITPAYAGKRSLLRLIVCVLKDHPRLCGEKSAPKWSTPKMAGSPPPMRGKELLFSHVARRIRITPAYAGKRELLSRCEIRFKDHPRLCGEKCRSISTWSVTVGSPPPMRGKVLDKPFLQRRCRITPAYAGKSFSNFIFRSSY